MKPKPKTLVFENRSLLCRHFKKKSHFAHLLKNAKSKLKVKEIVKNNNISQMRKATGYINSMFPDVAMCFKSMNGLVLFKRFFSQVVHRDCFHHPATCSNQTLFS